jgi:hypothetical protein
MMQDLSFNSQSVMYDIALIPEFQRMAENRELKLMLKQGCSTDEEFVHQVSIYIERSVLGLFHHDLETEKGFLHKLYALGYSKTEVAQSLAFAWLHNDVFFCLPKRSLWQRKRRTILMTVAFIFAAATVFEVVEFYKHEYTDLVAYMLVLAPILGAVGFVLSYLYFLILTLLFGLRR